MFIVTDLVSLKPLKLNWRKCCFSYNYQCITLCLCINKIAFRTEMLQEEIELAWTLMLNILVKNDKFIKNICNHLKS